MKNKKGFSKMAYTASQKGYENLIFNLVNSVICFAKSPFLLGLRMSGKKGVFMCYSDRKMLKNKKGNISHTVRNMKMERKRITK